MQAKKSPVTQAKIRFAQLQIDLCTDALHNRKLSDHGIDHYEHKLNLWRKTMYSYDNRTQAIEATPEKYVVMTTSGQFKGSWAKEKDALNWIKQTIKNDNDRSRRYLILEAIKEIGVKSPEIEIEEL